MYIVFHHSKIRSVCLLASYTEQGYMSAFCLSSCVGGGMQQAVPRPWITPNAKNVVKRETEMASSSVYLIQG